MTIVNFYFIHAKWLIDRKKVIDGFQKTISKYSFNSLQIGKIEVIEEMDPDEISAEFIQKNVNYTPLTDANVLPFNNFLKNLHINQLSNAVKHYKALEKITLGTGNEEELNIILEDDILYEEKVCLLLDKCIRQLPSNFDIVFLGLPTNKEITNRNTVTFQNTS